MKAWTDYPITQLGDRPHAEAPVREVEIISYDRNKYCQVLVGGVIDSIKRGYIYRKPGRYREVRIVDERRLRDYRGRHIWKLERAWGHQTSYYIYSYDPQQPYPGFESISAVKAYIVKHQITEGEIWKDHSTYGRGTSRFDHDFWRSINDPGEKRIPLLPVRKLGRGRKPK